MNLIKVISFVVFLVAFVCGGQWEETDRIDLPQGFSLRRFVRDYNGDLYVLGTNAVYKIDRRAKEISAVSDAAITLLIPTQRHGTLLVKDNGELIGLGQDIVQGKLPAVVTTNLVDGTAFEDSQQLYIVLLYRNRLAVYKDGVEQGMLPVQSHLLALIPRADYRNAETPFFTATDNQISLWQGSNMTRPANYRGQNWINSKSYVSGLAAAPGGQLFLATPESVYIYDRQGNRQDAIGNSRRPSFGEVRTASTPDTIYVYDRNSNQILVYIRHDRLSAAAGPVILEKNQPNPLESYTDIAFMLTEPLEIRLVVYNLIGGPVKVLAQGSYNQGHYQLRWDGKDDNGKPLPNGVYFYRLETQKGVKIRQLIVMR